MNQFSIEIYGKEQEILEGMLNMASSGSTLGETLPLLALVKGWHISKFLYYKDLIDEVSEK